MSLSGRSYLLITFIVLLGVVGQWVGDGVEYAWRLPAAAYLLAFTLEGVLSRLQPGFELRREWPAQIPLGANAYWQTTVQNLSGRNLQIESQFATVENLLSDPTLVRWRVPADAQQSKTFKIIGLRLGYVQPGTIYTRMLGRFGLAWWSKKIKHDDNVEVVPKTLANQASLVGSERTGDRRNKRDYSASGDFAFMRDYRIGDPLHTIDWKATARSQRTTVRVFTEDRHMELMLVVDAGRSSKMFAGSLTRLHHYVNVAARVAELGIQQGHRVGLLAFAHELVCSVPMGSGLNNLRRIRGELTELRTHDTESNPLAASLRLRKMLNHRSLVVFLTELEEIEAASQLRKAVSLLLPKHNPLIAGLIDTDVVAMQTQNADDWLDPYRNYAASEYMNSVERTAMTLRRMGASVVLAKPDRLDPAVFEYYRYALESRRV